MLRLQGMAFGEPTGGERPSRASSLPIGAHLGLVLLAGIYPRRLSWPGSSTSRRCCDERDAMMKIAADIGIEPWREAVQRLAAGETTLVSLWGDDARVRMAVSEPGRVELHVLSLPCPDGEFPSVGAWHPAAIRLERALVDLYGMRPTGAADARPWLDHGRWRVRAPLGAAKAREPAAERYAFLAAEGQGLHQIPVGPVHAGVIEPGHFRFHASGETVVRLEERLGYIHKGVEALMRGADLARAAILAGRISGDSTVAYSFAFSRAAEAALGLRRPSARPICAPRGGTRAARQSHRRHRRHLQRRFVRADAGPLRDLARTHPARLRRRVRASVDDGRDCPRRRRGRSDAEGVGRSGGC